MTEVTETEGTDEVVCETPAAPLTGIAKAIDGQISLLTQARDVASKLVGGVLDTQIGIRKTSVELRDSLIFTSRELHKLYASVLSLRSELLFNVDEVAVVNKKAAMYKKIAEMEKALKDM